MSVRPQLPAILVGWMALIACIATVDSVNAQATPGQFDLQGLTIPREQLRPGGPRKDGIPAISEPRFVRPADATSYLKPDDRVIGVVIGDHARAYPLRILMQHEVVNDQFADTSLAVTYCPLCDSSVVFDRRIGDDEVDFGVSGLLFNSNVVMYDRDPSGREGLWSQMGAVSVSGQRVKMALDTVPFEVTTWADWQRRHAHTNVLSRDTGFFRNYDRIPYARYFRNSQLMFPVTPLAPTDRLELKEPVLGVWNDAGARAYPVSVFRNGILSVNGQSLGEATFRVVYDGTADSLRLENVTGEVNRAYAFWFAWFAFHPETEVFNPGS